MREKSDNANGRIFVGVVLIVLGLLFFMRNLHFLFFNIDLFSWPVILLVIGILLIIKKNDSPFGFILAALGSLGIASKYFDIPVRSLVTDYWPFILIVLGLLIIFRRSPHHKNEQQESIDSEEYKIDLFTLLSSKKQAIKTNKFWGGKVSTILGESIIDLRNSELASTNIELDTQTILGSIDILVPNNWNVIIKTSTILGGFEDERAPKINSEDRQNTLVISGLTLLGGGKVRD